MTTSDDDDKDVLAAEFVLGTLDADDRANVQMLLAIDPGFAAIISKWERRLGELQHLVDPVEPPSASWEWIQARVTDLGAEREAVVAGGRRHGPDAERAEAGARDQRGAG